ncbi:alanine--tRNA ligase [Planctomycetota bacterium]
MLTAKEIRQRFIQFFHEHDHVFVPSAPVVPIGDETLMFTNAGMNQFKDIFLGLRTPESTRAVNSQKCIRVSGKHNDLEEVGIDTYHHTFFEMLGNWSFGDYFKAEAIEWAWKLFTEVYEIDPNLLWATVFAGDPADGSEPDEEAAGLWTKVTGIPAERLLRCGKKDNFWEMGAAGPCGPCSEIHIDLGPAHCDHQGVPGHECRVNGNCARYIELWNLVFIQFNRQEDGTLIPLGAKHIDTGAGLERITAVLQKKTSNYDTDLFSPIIAALSDLTGHKYTSQLGNKTDNAFRVIADHLRSLTMAITDGVQLSNEGRGYVMRRILRRAARFGRVLDAKEPFIYRLVPVMADIMGEAFPEVKERAEFVQTVIEAEEASFGRTLDRGLEIFAGAADKAQGVTDKTITGTDAFQLYDTFGFPFDLTQLLARERELKVDEDGFKQLMEAQRERARAGAKTASGLANLTGVELPVTDDSAKYTDDSVAAQVVGWIDAEGLKTEGVTPTDANEIGLILDKTCFYAESGGQVGDTGTIGNCDGVFKVTGTEKIADCVLHHGRCERGSLQVKDTVKATVATARSACKQNHTATHLLQWALQSVVGDTVHQQGSLVCPDYLRFDFTCPKALSAEQTAQIEDLVRGKITAQEPVTCAVLPIDKAKELGAMALFGEKYGNEVRVIGIGVTDESHLGAAFSREFCGGTHVNNTGQIGGFAITKEESISAGVRRITALTGQGLTDYLLERNRVVDELCVNLKVSVEQLPARVNKLLEDNKKLSKQLKNAAKQGGSDAMGQARKLLEDAHTVGDAHIIVGPLEGVQIQQAREAIDMLKKKAQSAAIVLGILEEDKVMLLVGVTDDLIEQGVKAGDIVKTIAPVVGGGGGGRPQMAQAGGKDPAKLPEALDKARELIKTVLAG